MKVLENWYEATENLMKVFVKRHFGIKTADYYWVADEIGGICYVNDRFFSLADMINFLKYKYTSDQVYEYADYSLECAEKKKTPVNIKHYLAFKDKYGTDKQM